MIPTIIARDVTVLSIRAVGNLYPIEHNPIEMQMPLQNLRIKIDDQIRELKVRILKKLMRLSPPCVLDKEYLRTVDGDTTVSSLTAFVRNAEPVPQWLSA